MKEHLKISEARIEHAKKDAYEISIGGGDPKKRSKKPKESEEIATASIDKFFGE